MYDKLKKLGNNDGAGGKVTAGSENEEPMALLTREEIVILQTLRSRRKVVSALEEKENVLGV